MTDGRTILADLNDRSREVFRRVVEGYLDNRRSGRLAHPDPHDERKGQSRRRSAT